MESQNTESTTKTIWDYEKERKEVLKNAKLRCPSYSVDMSGWYGGWSVVECNMDDFEIIHLREGARNCREGKLPYLHIVDNIPSYQGFLMIQKIEHFFIAQEIISKLSYAYKLCGNEDLLKYVKYYVGIKEKCNSVKANDIALVIKGENEIYLVHFL